MLQVPAQIWNRIAAHGNLKTEAAKNLFLLNQDAMTDQQTEQARLLERDGLPARVIQSYLTMAPLLMENEAISKYIQATENTALRRALPEVLTVAEAVTYSVKDWMLTKPEADQLTTLLQALYPTKANG